MIRAAVILTALLVALPALARTVADSAGRVLEIPDTVGRVFAAGPSASVLIHVLAPDTLLGWPRTLRPEERPYVPEAYRELPETGRLTGRGGEADLERVFALEPDLIIAFGSVTDTYVDLADQVHRKPELRSPGAGPRNHSGPRPERS
jgi:iron complex transport system substrate-binding protein